MALNSYNKKIKLNVDTLGLSKDLKEVERMFDNLSKSSVRKINKLEKEANTLRDKRLKLDEEKANIEKTTEVEKYKRAQEEYEQQRKRLESLKAIKKANRTDEQNKEIATLEQSTSKYSDEAAKMNSLFEMYKTYGSTEKTKPYDELFSYLYRLEQISSEELGLNEEALKIRGKQREEILSSKSLKEKTQEAIKSFNSNIKDSLKQSFNSFVISFNEKLKDTLMDAIKEYQNVASYSLSTSLKMNQEAREQALMYGLSDAQNYALTKAMSEIGANSVEDLYWMTPTQQERFSERIGYWTGQYNSLADKDAFKTLEQLQAELNDIKTDFQMEVVQFLSNNKDTIIEGMKLGVSLLQGIMNALSWLIGSPEVNNRESAVSDAINNYSNSSSSNTNVKIDNSFNGVGTDNLAKLRKAGNEVNRQLIKALNG